MSVAYCTLFEAFYLFVKQKELHVFLSPKLIVSVSYEEDEFMNTSVGNAVQCQVVR